MGLRAVPLLKDFDRVPHVAVGKVYSEVGSVNRPPLTPLHGEVNCSIRPQEWYQVCMCLCFMEGGASWLSPLNPYIWCRWAFSDPYPRTALHPGHHTHQRWQVWYFIPTHAIIKWKPPYKYLGSSNSKMCKDNYPKRFEVMEKLDLFVRSQGKCLNVVCNNCKYFKMKLILRNTKKVLRWLIIQTKMSHFHHQIIIRAPYSKDTI